MPITVGDRLPDCRLIRIGRDGPQDVTVAELTRGRKVVLFAVPGAFTPTCHSAHLPSFLRTRDGFLAKGVEAILCLATNDPHVMQAWGKATGATAAGVMMLSDSLGEFTAAAGMTIDRPGAWVNGRSKRYALYAEDGVVQVFHPETGSGCEISGGDALLAAL